jgi:hypothetical protein
MVLVGDGGEQHFQTLYGCCYSCLAMTVHFLEGKEM